MNLSHWKNLFVKSTDEMEEDPLIYSFMKHEWRPWFTVIRLDDFHLLPEDIRVKLNPISHSVIIKLKPTMLETHLTDRRYRRGVDMTRPVKYVVDLPKDIEMEKLQVKWTQHRELVICAPFKNVKLHENWPMNEETLNSRFLREKNLGKEISCINLPISGSFRRPLRNMRRTNLSHLLPFEKETLRVSESEDTDVTTTSESDSSESEWTTTDDDDEEEIVRHYLNKMKVLIKRYMKLLNKIFYPNTVEVIYTPLDITTTTASSRRIVRDLKKMPIIFKIKFINIESEDINVHLDVVRGEKVLIVEGKKIHECPTFDLTSVKTVRHIVPLPFFFNVDKMVYNVLPNGVLSIRLPLILKNKRDFMRFYEKLDKKELNKYYPCDY